MFLLFLLSATLYLARWNTSNFWDDTAHFIQVYRSIDNACTWEFLANVGHNGTGYITSDFGLGITYEVNTGYLYLITLCHYYEHTSFVGTEVFRSTDGGFTWQSTKDFGVFYTYNTYDYATAGITSDPFGNRLFCYFFRENPLGITVQMSTDGGFTWTQRSTLPSGSGTDLEGEMLVGPGGILWIADWFSNYPVCYRSTDGGISWLSSNISTQNGINWSARSVAIAYLYPDVFALTWGTGSSARLYRSTDLGASWQYVSTVISGYASEDGCCAMTSQYGSLFAVFWDASRRCAVYRSDDRGVTWQYVSNIPRPEPWYPPASAVTITTDRPPLASEENEAGQEERFIVSPIMSGLSLISLGNELPVQIYRTDGRLIASVLVKDRATVYLDPGIYYLRSPLGSRVSVVR
ncbi:MAG: sialidase family protein [candidate division WOR-3 bacterium]